MDDRLTWVQRASVHREVWLGALYFGPLVQAVLVVTSGDRWNWWDVAVISAASMVLMPSILAWLSPTFRAQRVVQRSVVVRRLPDGIHPGDVRPLLERARTRLRRDSWYLPAVLIGIAVLVAVAATRTEQLAWTLWLYAAAVGAAAPVAWWSGTRRVRAAAALSDQLDEATSPIG